MEKQRDFTATDQMFAQQRDAALPGVAIPVKHGRCLFTPLLAGCHCCKATEEAAITLSAQRNACTDTSADTDLDTDTSAAEVHLPHGDGSPPLSVLKQMTANKHLAQTQELQLTTPLVYVDGSDCLISDMRVLFANTTTPIS